MVYDGILKYLQFSPGHGTDGLQNPSKDPYPICNAIPLKESEEVETPKPGTISGFISAADCDERPCTCAAMDAR